MKTKNKLKQQAVNGLQQRFFVQWLGLVKSRKAS
jgi:hypothetical protein